MRSASKAALTPSFARCSLRQQRFRLLHGGGIVALTSEIQGQSTDGRDDAGLRRVKQLPADQVEVAIQRRRPARWMPAGNWRRGFIPSARRSQSTACGTSAGMPSP